MARITRAISITPEQDKFLKENPSFNLSSMAQNQIDILMERAVNPMYIKELTEKIDMLEKNLAKWRDMYYKAQEFINLKGFLDDFMS